MDSASRAGQFQNACEPVSKQPSGGLVSRREWGENGVCPLLFAVRGVLMSRVGNRIGVVALLAAMVSAPAVAADEVDYLRDVKSIFKVHCVRCHGPLKSEAGLRLDTKALALKGGENGAALAPGQAESSLLLKRVLADKEMRMPPEGAGLSKVEIETLTRWIAAGAVSPEGETAEDPRNHWSYRPVKRPDVPKVAAPEWSQNPVDAFVFTRQQQGRVTPQPVAPRHVLLRRVSLDLVGLPPSSDQLQEFLADKSPDA